MLNIFNSSTNQKQPSLILLKAYFKKAANFFESKQFKSALDIYSQIIELDPKSPEAYTERGIIRILQKEWDLASQDLSRALALDKNYFKARYWKAIILARLSRYKEASDEFDKIISETKSNFPKVYFYRGFVKTKMNFFKSAIFDLSKSINLNENIVESYFWRGIAKYKWGDMVGAVHDLNTSLSIVSENQEFDSIIECIKEYSSIGTIYYNNGIYQAELGRYNEALKDLTSVKSFFAMEKELLQSKVT
jgi:tetratricopeptide (TPR) repeat protein